MCNVLFDNNYKIIAKIHEEEKEDGLFLKEPSDWTISIQRNGAQYNYTFLPDGKKVFNSPSGY